VLQCLHTRRHQSAGDKEKRYNSQESTINNQEVADRQEESHRILLRNHFLINDFNNG
jgi:hypothetical protein